MRYKFYGVASAGNGSVVGAMTVSVFLAGTTTPASIYAASSGGVAVNSVLTTDTVTDVGRYSFYVDDGDYSPTQNFDITFSKTGYNSQTYSNIKMGEPVLSTHNLYAWTTATATIANTSETSLGSRTLGLGTFGNNGQGIHVIAFGEFGGNANNKTVRIRIGGLTGDILATLTTGAYNAKDWKVELHLFRTASGTGQCVYETKIGLVNSDSTTYVERVAISSSRIASAATSVMVTGQNGTASANDITCHGLLVEYF